MSSIEKLYNLCRIENINSAIPATASSTERNEIISMLSGAILDTQHLSLQELAAQLESIATEEEWTSTSSLRAKISTCLPKDLEKMNKWLNLSTLIEVLAENIPQTLRETLLNHEHLIRESIVQAYREKVASLNNDPILQYLPKQALLLNRISMAKQCSAETCIETLTLFTKMRTHYEEFKTALPNASTQEQITLAHLRTFEAEQVHSIFGSTIQEQSTSFKNFLKTNFPSHFAVKENSSIFLFTKSEIPNASGKSKFASTAIKLDTTVQKILVAASAIQLNCFSHVKKSEIDHEINIYNRLRSENQPEEIVKAYVLRRLDPISQSVLLYEACEGDLLTLMQKEVNNRYKTSFYIQSLKICQDAAKALAYMHAKKIVHGDIKWENVLYKSMKGKLSDFGSSFNPTTATDPKSRCQTSGYGAPESARNEPIEDYFKLDIWAFGVLIGNLVLDKQLGNELCFESIGLHSLNEMLFRRENEFKLTSEECFIPDLTIRTLAYKRFIDNVLTPLHYYLNPQNLQNSNLPFKPLQQKIHFTLLARILTPKVLSNDYAILKAIMNASSLEQQISLCASYSIFDPASRPTAQELVTIIEGALKELSEIG